MHRVLDIYTTIYKTKIWLEDNLQDDFFSLINL